MNRFKYTLFSVLLLVLSQSQTMAQDYFPLKENSLYYYTATYNNLVFHDTIQLKKYSENNATCFYFHVVSDFGTGVDLIESGLFLGTYFRSGDSLFFINATDLEELKGKGKDQGQLVMTFPLIIGQSHQVKAYDGDSTFINITGFENVSISGGTFKKCAMVERISFVNGFRFSTDLFWLAPDVGIVKIERLSGRKEELSGYKFSGKKK
ncbi:MAG: hypothetical protein V2A54_14595 [Bacteroidota bacterium]